MSQWVISLGEVLWDCLTTDSYPPATWTAYAGGAPANVACGLQKLGTPAAFIGCVGQDAAGMDLVHILQAQGINLLGLQVHPTAPTRRILVLCDERGDRHFAGFLNYATDEFADTFLQAEAIPETLFAQAQFLVLGTLGLAYDRNRAAYQRAIHLAQRYHVPILVDINWRPMFWADQDAAQPAIYDLLQQVQWVKLSTEEAMWLFQTTDAAVIAYRLNHLSGVLLTAGDQGCYYWFPHCRGDVPAFAVPAVDTTGAGDSFVAGFLHQISQQGSAALSDPQRARLIVEYASAVGALTTLKAGAIAAQPSAAEVAQFLSTYQQAR